MTAAMNRATGCFGLAMVGVALTWLPVDRFWHAPWIQPVFHLVCR